MTKAEWIAHLVDMREYSESMNLGYDAMSDEDDENPWAKDIVVLTEVIEFLKNCEVNV